jgi:hypothetical protein
MWVVALVIGRKFCFETAQEDLEHPDIPQSYSLQEYCWARSGRGLVSEVANSNGTPG